VTAPCSVLALAMIRYVSPIPLCNCIYSIGQPLLPLACACAVRGRLISWAYNDRHNRVQVTRKRARDALTITDHLCVSHAVVFGPDPLHEWQLALLYDTVSLGHPHS
jgi:predicted signal transduction protein with EAL and GGDEF domain